MYKHSQALQMHKHFDLWCINILTKKKINILTKKKTFSANNFFSGPVYTF